MIKFVIDNNMTYQVYRINTNQNLTLLEFEIYDVSDLDIENNIATFYSLNERCSSYKKSVINLDYYIIFKKP
jgi:hypothetical protein